MSGPDQKVLICTLWQRTSERGNEYLNGFLGKARIVGFRGEPTADGTQTWNLYLTPGREQEEGTRAQPSRPRQTPTAMSRTGVERWRRKEQVAAPDPTRPFFSDDISDIGGGQS